MMEWQLVTEPVTNEAEIEKWLQKGFEPFAIGDDEHGVYSVWLKQFAFTERGEAKSSTHPENFNVAGNERD